MTTRTATATAKTNVGFFVSTRMTRLLFVGYEVLAGDLGQEALPVFPGAAVGLVEVFEDALEVGVALEVAPGGVFREPGVVFVAEVDGAAEPVEGFGLVAFHREVGGQAVGHLAVGFGGGESFVDDEGGGLFALAELDVAEGDGGVDDAQR